MNSIRNQLTRRLLIGLLLLLAGGLGAVYFAMRSALLYDFDESLRAKVQVICTITEINHGRVELDFSDHFLRNFSEDVATDFFQLWHHNGEVIFRSPSLHGLDLPHETNSFNSARIFDLALGSGRRTRVMELSFTPINEEKNLKSEPIKVDLLMANDRSELDRTLNILGAVLVGCGSLFLLGTSIFVPRLLKQGLAPLDLLADETARIDAESLSLRFATKDQPDEIHRVSECLNLLLCRLEESFERERRFSADLAHELRTPLAELRNLTEVALKWPESRDVQTDQETLAISLHMESLVKQMLAMARSENGRLLVEKHRIDITNEMYSAWERVAKKAAGRNITSLFKMPLTLEIESDPTLLRSILNNLLDNAVEYSPASSKIFITLRSGESNFELGITNSTVGLVPEDVGRLFERFWRRDESRSGGEHTGLGLSLSRAFAEALGWRLNASLGSDHNLTFTLTLNS
jgi:two-component system sensor histidine kinase QseC